MKRTSEDIEYLLTVIVIALFFVLFGGEPDVADAIRIKALNWAGIEAANTGEGQ
jgi:hypothetical protein